MQFSYGAFKYECSTHNVLKHCIKKICLNYLQDKYKIIYYATWIVTYFLIKKYIYYSTKVLMKNMSCVPELKLKVSYCALGQNLFQMKE